MKKQAEIRVINEHYTDSMEEAINSSLKDGFELIGPVQVVSRDVYICFIATMVKYEE